MCAQESVLWVVPTPHTTNEIPGGCWEHKLPHLQREMTPGAYLNFLLQNSSTFCRNGIIKEVFSTSNYIWKTLYFLWLGC